jgi:MYXO-CTERM domain-containing protein
MKRGNRALLRIVAVGQVLLLVVAGCKSSSDKVTHAVVVDQALVGKDGAVTVTDPNTVVNEYAALAADADVNDPSVTVATGLTGLAAGDLVLIIQMAGATINEPTDPNDASYGTVTALGSAGNYELAGVASVSGTTITLGCHLQKAYTVAGKSQVIRVPQYSTLTINSGASIIAPAWDGTKGGVVALQAATTLDLNGSIDASATGFRGGVTHTGNVSAVTDLTIYSSADPNDGAEKGESIAGWPHDPNFALPFGRGAPANGGGGGNWHNGGGGGGANAAASGVGSDGGGANWTGQGVMLSSVTGAAAWLLDPGYALSGGPGGGRGGYTYSSANQDATTDGPGNANWGGNYRRERGGLGGRPLTSSPAGRLFLGGGGGAGDGNNFVGGNLIAGPGGQGGGLVFVIAGAVTGTGSILANGAPGGAANSGATTSGDAPGGGGGGGTVVVHAGTLGQNVVVRANGGVGGTQHIVGVPEAEGPGGGGGGGYIALSGGVPTTVTADGGGGGTTDSPGLTEFPPNGATAGQAGLIENTAAVSMLYCTNPVVTMSTKPTDPTSTGQGTFAFTSAQSGVTFQCNLDSTGYSTCPASYTTTDLTDGSHTLLVQGIDLNGNLSTTPASWTWHVLHAGDSDAGVDAEAENLDVAVLDVPPVFDDAGTLIGLDAGEGLDGVALSDAGEDTGAADGPGTVILLDAATRQDVALAAIDAGPPVKLDAAANGTDGAEDTSGDGSELEAGAQDAQVVVVVEPSVSDASVAIDQAVSPQPDAAGTHIADAAVPGPDAAVPSFKAMGGGFCSVSPMHDSAPGLFTLFLLAAFGLLVVRRRR